MVFHHRILAFLDVNGCVKADPYWLKGTVMPRVEEVGPEDCSRFARALTETGIELAVQYQIDGRPYLHFPGFREHQAGLRVDRETPEVPVPEGFDHDAGVMPASVRRASGKRPESCPPEVEVEGEVEVEEERGDSAREARPSATDDRADLIDTEGDHENPMADGRGDVGGPVPLDVRGPVGAEDPIRLLLAAHDDRDAYAALLACWAAANHPDGVPDSLADEQAAAGWRLVAKHDRETLARLVFGIGRVYPHSAGEGWNLRDLELKGDKAFKAARDGGAKNATKVDRNIEAIMTADLG